MLAFSQGHPMSQKEPLRCAGLVVDDDNLSESGNRIRIPRTDVRSLELRRGSPVQHPLVMFVFGTALLAAGLYEVGRIVGWWFHGGVLFGNEVLLLAFLLLGGYAVYEAVQRVPMRLVRTNRGPRRLLFRRPVSRAQLAEFARALETELGQSVEVRL
jgi:hypothetical protein